MRQDIGSHFGRANYRIAIEVYWFLKDILVRVLRCQYCCLRFVHLRCSGHDLFSSFSFFSLRSLLLVVHLALNVSDAVFIYRGDPLLASVDVVVLSKSFVIVD